MRYLAPRVSLSLPGGVRFLRLKFSWGIGKEFLCAMRSIEERFEEALECVDGTLCLFRFCYGASTRLKLVSELDGMVLAFDRISRHSGRVRFRRVDPQLLTTIDVPLGRGSERERGAGVRVAGVEQRDLGSIRATNL